MWELIFTLASFALNFAAPLLAASSEGAKVEGLMPWRRTKWGAKKGKRQARITRLSAH